MAIIALMTIIYILSRYLSVKMVEMFSNPDIASCRALNYRGRAIPAVGGIVFVPVMLAAVLLLLFLYPHRSSEYQAFLLLICSMGFSGIVDDMAGNKNIKGFKGHIGSAISGHMTTGFIKAATGILAACIISLKKSAGLSEVTANILVIALWSNTVNLFDLRPGRAIKVYAIAALILLYAALPDITAALPLMALLIAVLAYSSFDLKEICMLGDTGANILGISIGYYSIVLLDSGSRLVIAAALIILNLVAEKVSISDLVSGSRILSYLDSLGRVDESRDDRA